MILTKIDLNYYIEIVQNVNGIIYCIIFYHNVYNYYDNYNIYNITLLYLYYNIIYIMIYILNIKRNIMNAMFCKGMF